MPGLLIEGGVYFLIVFTPFAFGAVESWAIGVLQIVSGLVVAAWAWEFASAPTAIGSTPGGTRWFWIPLGLFLLLIGAQLAPLPPSWLSRLSPGVHRIYVNHLPGYADGRGIVPQDLPDWLLKKGGDRIPPSEGVAPSSASGTVPAVAPAVVSRTPWRSSTLAPDITRERLAVVVCLVALLAVCAGRFPDGPGRRRLLAVIAITAAAVSVLGVIQSLTWNGRIYWVRAGDFKEVFGPFVSRNAYAAHAGLALPIALALALRERGRPGRAVAWGACAGSILAGVLLSLSRAGMLSAAVAIVVFLSLSAGGRRWRKAAAVSAVVMVLAAGAALALEPRAFVTRIGTFARGLEETSLAERIEGWRRAAGMFAENPWLGTGLGTFKYGFMEHAPPGETWWMTAHSDYVETACETGLAGALLAGLALAAFLVLSARPDASSGADGRLMHAGIAAGLAGLLLHSGISSNLQVPAVGLLAAVAGGALLGLAPPGASVPRLGRRPARRLTVIGLASVVALTIWSGVTRVAAALDRRQADRAIAAVDLSGALEYLEGASAWRPSDPIPHLMRGDIVYRHTLASAVPLRQMPQATPDELLERGTAEIARAVALNPSEDWSWYGVANLYLARRAARVRMEGMRRAGDVAQREGEETGPAGAPGLSHEDRVAAAALVQAAALRPSSYVPHDVLARLFWQRGHQREAAREIEASLSLWPVLEAHDPLEEPGLQEDLSEAILRGIDRAATGRFISAEMKEQARAGMLARLGRDEEAAQGWEALYERGDPAVRARAALELGRLAQRRGAFESSLTYLEQALAYGIDTPWGTSALYHLGRARAELGGSEEAIAYFQEYMSRRPALPLGYLALATEQERQGRVEEASRQFDEALERFPDEPGTNRAAIGFRRRQGDLEGALALARRYAGRSPRDPSARDLLREIEAEASGTMP